MAAIVEFHSCHDQPRARPHQHKVHVHLGQALPQSRCPLFLRAGDDIPHPHLHEHGEVLADRFTQSLVEAELPVRQQPPAIPREVAHSAFPLFASLFHLPSSLV